MITLATTTPRDPAVFALAAPAIWITVAVYTDEGGQEHVAVARIAAWHEQDACAYLEDQIIEDVLGVDPAEVREAWEADDPEYGDRLWISEVLAFSTDELNAKRVLGTPAACRALALATGCHWDNDHEPATDRSVFSR
jgi:hypothetical protein